MLCVGAGFKPALPDWAPARTEKSLHVRGWPRSMRCWQAASGAWCCSIPHAMCRDTSTTTNARRAKQCAFMLWCCCVSRPGCAAGWWERRLWYVRLHAASKAAVFGVIPILLAISRDSEPAVALRSLLIAVFLLLTTPVGAHAMARATFYKGNTHRMSRSSIGRALALRARGRVVSMMLPSPSC